MDATIRLNERKQWVLLDPLTLKTTPVAGLNERGRYVLDVKSVTNFRVHKEEGWPCFYVDPTGGRYLPESDFKLHEMLWGYKVSLK